MSNGVQPRAAVRVVRLNPTAALAPSRDPVVPKHDPLESLVILEAAILTVRPKQDEAFTAALAKARPLIAASPGFQRLEVWPCVEQPHRYLLLVWWERLSDHAEGFRGSERYQEWKALLHHFYDPFPTVEHFGPSIL